MKSAINVARFNKPEGFKYIEHTLQANISSDPSWQPIKDIVEQVKHEYVDTMFQQIKNSVDAGFPPIDRYPIERDITALQRDDPKGLERLDREIQGKVVLGYDEWQPIKNIVDSVKNRPYSGS